MLKIGDKVRIRKDLTGEMRFRGNNWGMCCLPIHLKYIGMGAIITEVNLVLQGLYRIDLDNGQCFWNEEMFEEFMRS